MKNKKRDRCTRCGGWVAAGDGVLTKREQEDGRVLWSVTHAEPCQPGEPEPMTHEPPRWAVYGYGRTGGGNDSHGVRLMSADERPIGDDGSLAVPLNDSARQMVERAEKEQRDA